MNDTDVAPGYLTQTHQYGKATDLSGKTALITGAASGIGRACALALAAAGARIVVVDLDEAGAVEVAQLTGGEYRPADLADLADLSALGDAAEVAEAADIADIADLVGLGAANRRGSLAADLARGADIVVNNAGFQVVQAVQDFPPDMFRRMLAVMVEAPFHLVRAALPGMYERGWGRVVNISSVHGLRASAFKAGYVTAKHALEGLSKVVAVEGGPHGVTSNCINPGYVRTPLVEKQINDQAAAHGIPRARVIDEVLLARSAVKRLIEPEEVAELAVYLCAPAASFINGASIVVDGAWTAQ